MTTYRFDPVDVQHSPHRQEEETQVNVEGIERIQTKLESITRRWWFYVLFAPLQFVPPYAAKGYDWSETGSEDRLLAMANARSATRVEFAIVSW
jgi:hypothetical protein